MATKFDTCPVDILHLILDDACTDAGNTAQALSLTSRHLSAVSSSYRHRNIVLRGLAQVQRAVRYFSVLPQECRRVQHIFIADDPEEYLSTDKPTCLNPGAPRRDVPALKGRGGDGVFYGELFQAATDELLDLLAPTLRTLACHTVNPWQKFILSNVQKIHFPRLTSLILHQTTRVPFPQHDQPIGVNMPNLRRLHLAYSGMGYTFFRVKRVVVFFVTHCPRLQHLRLSDVNLGLDGPDMLVRLVESISSPWEEASLDSDYDEPAPAKVARMMVQLEERSKVKVCEEDLAALRTLERAKEGTPCGFFVVGVRLKRSLEEWEDEWLRVAQGCHEAWEG